MRAGVSLLKLDLTSLCAAGALACGDLPHQRLDVRGPYFRNLSHRLCRRQLDPAALERTFNIRAKEGFLTLFSAPIASAITQDAPLVRLRFMPKPDKDAGPLRGRPKAATWKWI
jgi:hypothetical protein